MASSKDEIIEYGMGDLGKLDSLLDYVDSDIMITSNVENMSSTRPTRGNIYSIIACERGQLAMEVNSDSYTIGRGDLLFCLPNVIINNVSVSDDFHGSVICLTSRMVQGLLGTNVSLWNRTLYVDHRVKFHITSDDATYIMHYADLLRQKLDEKDNPFRTEIIQSILRAVMFEMCGLMLSYAGSDGEKPVNQAEILFNKFIELLSAEKQKKQPVYYYASQLCISPKYLSVVCKQMSGKTASDWIEEYLGEDIRFYLRNTMKPIKEICEILNFPNLSFFGKYVKAHFGCTPMEFRRQRQGNV